MPLPILAVVAARLGIRLATYMIRNQFKKGAAKKLRKVVTKKQAEIAKKKTTSEKGYRGQGSKRKEEKVTQRKKPKVDSGLSIKKSSRSGKGKLSRKIPISEKGKGFHEQKYKTTIKVKIKDPKEKYEERKKMRYRTEEIKGLNKGHALARAKSNWPGSAVIKRK